MKIMEMFDGLAVSSKFAICGLPIRLDSYRSCTFGCKYCFANGRKIMEFDKTKIAICNVNSIEERLKRIKANEYSNENFLDVLIANNITWHCGGMSDPFQPAEKKLGVTRQLIDMTSKYGIHILFSTKSDTIYNANVDANLHTFQLSISNLNNRKDIEPNVPDIESRYNFFRQMKDKGFRVGVRIQPFIPNISSLEIIEKFKDADHFTIEGIKYVPQNKEQRQDVISILDSAGFTTDNAFTCKGLMNLKPHIRLQLYEPFVKYFNDNNISYSIADNDLRCLSNNSCCCGDKLVDKSSTFNITYLIEKYGTNYKLSDVMKEIDKNNISDCKCYQLFTSNRTQGCKKVNEFFFKRFGDSHSPFSPKFQYQGNKQDLFNQN